VLRWCLSRYLSRHADCCAGCCIASTACEIQWRRLRELVDLFCNHMKRPVCPKTFISTSLPLKNSRRFRVLVGGMEHVYNWQREGVSCSYCLLPSKTVPQTLMGLQAGSNKHQKANVHATLGSLLPIGAKFNFIFQQQHKNQTTFACSIPPLLCMYVSQGDVHFGSVQFVP